MCITTFILKKIIKKKITLGISLFIVTFFLYFGESGACLETKKKTQITLQPENVVLPPFSPDFFKDVSSELILNIFQFLGFQDFQNTLKLYKVQCKYILERILRKSDSNTDAVVENFLAIDENGITFLPPSNVKQMAIFMSIPSSKEIKIEQYGVKVSFKRAASAPNLRFILDQDGSLSWHFPESFDFSGSSENQAKRTCFNNIGSFFIVSSILYDYPYNFRRENPPSLKRCIEIRTFSRSGAHKCTIHLSIERFMQTTSPLETFFFLKTPSNPFECKMLLLYV